MQIIAKFDPNAATTGEFALSELSNGIGTIILWNESNWTLDITMPNGNTDIAPAWTASIFEPTGPQGQVQWSQDAQLDLVSPPISKVWVIAYQESENIAGTYPCALVRQMGVGNIVSTSGGSSINISDDGRAPGAQTVEATAAGDGSSAVVLTNIGNLTLGNATHHGSISSDRGLFTTDGSGNVTLNTIATNVALEGLNVINNGTILDLAGNSVVPISIGVESDGPFNLATAIHTTLSGAETLQAIFTSSLMSLYSALGISGNIAQTIAGSAGNCTLYQPFRGLGLNLVFVVYNGFQTSGNVDTLLSKAFTNDAQFFTGEMQGGNIGFLNGASLVNCSVQNTISSAGGTQNANNAPKSWSQGQTRGAFNIIRVNFTGGTPASGMFLVIGN